MRCLLPCLLASLAILLSAAPAAAVLIAEESFEYANGTPLSGTEGGIGWDGPWFTSPVNKADNMLAEGTAEFPKLRSGGNQLRLNGRDVRNFRRLDTLRPELADLVEDGAYGKTFGKSGTTIWIGFLISLDSPAAAHGGIHLCDGVGDLSVDPFGDKRAHQRIQLGRNNLMTHWVLCRVTNGGPGAGKWESAVKADATRRLLAYRFDFRAGGATCSMFIDPEPGREPQPSAAALTAPDISDFRFNAINVGSGGGAIFTLDEIRIGTTFADVTPTR